MRVPALLLAALAPAAAALSMQQALSLQLKLKPAAVQAAAQDAGARRRAGASLCSEGRLLPQLYVPGAMKAGTTTMFEYLAGASGAGITNPCPWGLLSKECAFFNGGLNWLFNATEKRARWLQELTPCPADGEPKQVAGDFTPSYLNSVPPPSGMELRGITFGSRSPCLGPSPPLWCIGMAAHAVARPPGADPYAALKDMNVPRDIATLYGNVSGNLTFVVILREPVSRMQSQWYFAKLLHYVASCDACKADTFEHAMQSAADHHLGSSGERFTEDFLWDSLYAAQLKVWLSFFGGSQFVVVPNSRLSDRAVMTELCEVLEARLDFSMDCEHFIKEQETSALRTDHPPLEEDLSPATQKVYQEQVFGQENAELFSMLASMRAEGANLVGFEGAGAPDAASVEAWLTAGW